MVPGSLLSSTPRGLTSIKWGLLQQLCAHHTSNCDNNGGSNLFKLAQPSQPQVFRNPTAHSPLHRSCLCVHSRTPLRSLAYGTWALSGFSRSSSSRLQPYLEIEEVIANIPNHLEVIEKRKTVKKPNITQIADLFQKAKDLKIELDKVTKSKEENTAKVQVLLKASADSTNNAEIHSMREKGRDLRDEVRRLSKRFQEVNDTLIGLVLAIPNQLDTATPQKEYKLLRKIAFKEGVEGFKLPEDFHWEYLNHVGPNAEYAVGPAAMVELEVATLCQKFLLSNEFTETGNVDFVKRILLDGTGLDPKQFLKVREIASKTGEHHATYLVGGATFPAFLALFAQSVIQQKEVLPIRYFVIGRSYTNTKEIENEIPVQDTVVQAFVACKDHEQEEEEFKNILGIMEKFYSEVIGVESESRLLAAPELKSYEKKKVVFVQSNGAKIVGELATTGDYVSKRLLCCYNDQRIPKFLHLITAQFFNITDFIRPMLPPPRQYDEEKFEHVKAEAEAIALATKTLPPNIEASSEIDQPTDSEPSKDANTTKKE